MTQRTWLITGVNSGFGRLMTEQLLARGDRVAGTVRKPGTMNDLKEKYGELLWLAHLDLIDTPEIHKVVSKAFADLGKIDVTVNNAGYGLFGAAGVRYLARTAVAFRVFIVAWREDAARCDRLVCTLADVDRQPVQQGMVMILAVAKIEINHLPCRNRYAPYDLGKPS